MKKRALVLAGGGARGAYQVGMLHELVIEQKLDFHTLRGVSVGALNASYLAQAPLEGGSQAALQAKVRDLESLWLSKIKGNHSVYSSRAGFAGLVAGADSLYSLAPLRKLIEQELSVDALRASGRDFAVGTVSLVSGLYQEWGVSDPQFIERLVASASIPVVFPYVDFKSEKEALVDGGVRNITPLSSAFATKPDEIYILLTSRVVREGDALPPASVQSNDYEQWDDNWLGTKVGGLDVLKRTLEILTDEIYLDDIRGALDWNIVVQAASMPQKTVAAKNALAAVKSALKRVKKRYVPIYVLAPREWYGSKNDATDFSPDMIKRAVDHGRDVAKNKSLWVWPPVKS